LMKKDSLIQQDPKITDYYMQKANIYSQVKEYDLAVATLSEALKISPENGEIFAFRAYIHYTMGNRESALLDLAQAERLTGKTDTELSRLIKEKK
jgi:tetratricopeptide (TPR) repeat protein